MSQPTTTPFFELLEARCKKINSLLCVGLDPHETDIDKLQEKQPNVSRDELTYQFCEKIIEATSHVAAAYKPNSAFFEALGAEGIACLIRVIASIPKDIPVVLDAKRGDISSTAIAYAQAAFDAAKANCITLHPYMGYDSIEPFVRSNRSKGCFVLCKTSNPSSKDFETLKLENGDMLYEVVARKCSKWNEQTNNIGLVVGATDIEALTRARNAAPQLWILAPGVGFQGGNLQESAKAGLRNDGMGLLVPVSRGISRADDPKKAAEDLRDALNSVRNLKASDDTKSNKIEPYQRDFFRLALRCGVLKFGTFTLKSGRISPYFFNAGLFNTGKALAQLGEFYAEAIIKSKIEYDVLFGPAYKGIPLVTVIAVALQNKFGLDIPCAYNRKEAKDHGEGGLLVGAPVAGKRVLIVDDVITAGTAVRQSLDILTKAQAQVVGVTIALDREEKANDTTDKSAIQAVKAEFGINVCSIAGLTSMLEFLKSSDEFEAQPDVYSNVDAYREKYGVN